MEAVGAPVLAYASPGRRLLAAFIDNFVVSFVALAFTGSASQRFGDAIVDNKTPDLADVMHIMVATLLSIVVYSTALHAWRGVTLGKMAARIVLVNEDGTRVTAATAFVRSVTLVGIFFISVLTRGIPMLVNELRPIWNSRRQTWHDAVAHTVVVRADSIDIAATYRRNVED